MSYRAVGVMALLGVWLAWYGTGPVRAQAADPADAECVQALARFLPGEFNYCLAQRAWYRGQHAYALEMFELAASWGSKPAQELLGVVHFNGEHTARNRPLGLAWLALASERGESRRKARFLSAWQQASQEERAQADRLYLTMRETFADDIAAQRADRRFNRELKAFRSNPVFGHGTCLVGTAASVGKIQESYQTSGDSPPGSNAGCTLVSEDRTVQDLEIRRDMALRGWRGKVDVGPLEPVATP